MSSDIIARHFGLADVPGITPRWNIAPGQDIAAVRTGSEGTRELAMLRWGLVPSWAKDPAIGSRLINARAETAAEKPSFRAAWRRRRCIVPADGFYEWQKVGSRKQPWLIRVAGAPAFGIAGLWESWQDPDGEAIQSCTLLTTGASAAMRPVHDRMPLILAPDDYDRWLEPADDDTGEAPGTAEGPELELVAVSTRVNNPANDDVACILPVTDAEPDLFDE